MKRKLLKILIIITLIIIYSYVLVITNIPDNMVIFEGETISVNKLLGFKINLNNINGQSVETSANNNNKLEKSGKTTAKVSLFNNILVKNVNIDVLPKTKVIPVGSIAGLKLYTSGVLVVGMSEIEGNDNKKYKPYENTGIKEGDTIIEINENKIKNAVATLFGVRPTMAAFA